MARRLRNHGGILRSEKSLSERFKLQYTFWPPYLSLTFPFKIKKRESLGRTLQEKEFCSGTQIDTFFGGLHISMVQVAKSVHLSPPESPCLAQDSGWLWAAAPPAEEKALSLQAAAMCVG